MNKIRIIDLLNKIANGEEVPNKIIIGDSKLKYHFNKELKDYIAEETQEKLFEDEIGKFLKYYINDEVEIIEEEKKIPEKLNLKLDDWTTPTQCDIELSKKIDEIIDYLNSKGDE